MQQRELQLGARNAYDRDKAKQGIWVALGVPPALVR
jgi:hypothetical protein